MKNLILLYGGTSAERIVSKHSAENIFQALNRMKFNIFLVFIDQDATWYFQGIDAKIDLFFEKNNIENECTLIRKQSKVYLLTLKGERFEIDVGFPILHGGEGENGAIQGLFETINLPYIGCDILSSSIGFNKDIQKKIFLLEKIPILPFKVLNDQNQNFDYNTVSKDLDSKLLFAKPCCSGFFNFFFIHFIN